MNRLMNHRRCCNHRAGYTLLEMMTTLPAIVFIAAGMATSVIIMFQAKRVDDNQFRNTYNAAAVTQQLAMDLESACSITSATSTRCDFYVPDRNGDGFPERMCYQWTGPSGSPANTIQQIYHNNAVQNILSNVTTFGIYYYPQIWDAVTSDPTNAEQTVLRRHDLCEGGTISSFRVGNANVCAQYFLPTLPSGATSWELGGIRFMAKCPDTSSSGTLNIQLRTANASNQPTTTILTEVTIDERLIGPSYRWVDIPITPIKGLTSTQGICIVLRDPTNSQNVADIMFQQNGSAMPTNANWFTSTNNGTTWSTANTTHDMRFYAYGRYNTVSGTRRFMSEIGLTLETNNTSAQRIEHSVRLLSMPEVLP